MHSPCGRGGRCETRREGIAATRPCSGRSVAIAGIDAVEATQQAGPGERRSGADRRRVLGALVVAVVVRGRAWPGLSFVGEVRAVRCDEGRCGEVGGGVWGQGAGRGGGGGAERRGGERRAGGGGGGGGAAAHSVGAS